MILSKKRKIMFEISYVKNENDADNKRDQMPQG